MCHATSMNESYYVYECVMSHDRLPGRNRAGSSRFGQLCERDEVWTRGCVCVFRGGGNSCCYYAQSGLCVSEIGFWYSIHSTCSFTFITSTHIFAHSHTHALVRARVCVLVHRCAHARRHSKGCRTSGGRDTQRHALWHMRVENCLWIYLETCYFRQWNTWMFTA